MLKGAQVDARNNNRVTNPHNKNCNKTLEGVIQLFLLENGAPTWHNLHKQMKSFKVDYLVYIIIIIMYLYSVQYLHILQDSKPYLTRYSPNSQVTDIPLTGR